MTIVLAGSEELVEALEDDLEEVANMFPAKFLPQLFNYTI
jgi:hypothetical protein